MKYRNYSDLDIILYRIQYKILGYIQRSSFIPEGEAEAFQIFL
jgi:hypothetical protein